jgi:hypothetical protein
LSSASLASAQSKGISASIGYEALHVDNNPCTGCDWNWYQYGFNVDAAKAWRGPLALLGEFAWSRHPFGDAENPQIHIGGMNALDLGGGVRWTAKGRGKLTPYAQATLGYHKDYASGPKSEDLIGFVGPNLPESAFMVHPAGGVFVPVSPAWGFIGQIGYRRVFSNEGINGFHVVAGVRLHGK